MNVNERRIESRENILKVMDKTFVMVPAKLLRDVAEGKISSSAFQVYCYVLFREGIKGKYWGSIQDICWGTGLSSAQVSRCLKQLIERGHIAREKRIGTTWITYCLTRVDGHKIIFRGKSGFGGAPLDRDIAVKTATSDDQHGSREFRKPTTDDEVSETVRLFEKELCCQQSKADQLRRELLGNQPRSNGRIYKEYYSSISNHY
jgi:predicted DNA-binding transcriptional regulator